MQKYFKPIEPTCTKTSKHVASNYGDRQKSQAETFKLSKRNLHDLPPPRDDGDGQDQARPPPLKKIKTEVCRLQPTLSWRKISDENLDCDYVQLYRRQEATELFHECERQLDYFTAKELTRVQVYGKWHSIPRKQLAHGDSGLTYKYSGVAVPANPWTPLLMRIRGRIQEATGHRFNFVLINRYKDGNDYIGEHRDDETQLVRTSPIASLSLGQARDFVFRHGESRGKNAKRRLAPIKVVLEHGSLLTMNHPTNVHWYHSLPVRKNAVGVRINMTFRCLKT